MKALVIGANGFAGRYLCEELEANAYEVVKADCILSDNVRALNLLSSAEINAALCETKPDIVFNLAGLASVAASWQTPQDAVDLNVKGTLNLLEAVRHIAPKTRVLLIGSSEQYGRAECAGLSANEHTPLDPLSPYAISKCCQESFGRLYHEAYGLDICMTRSFNHIGAGQKRGFVVTDFASGIADIERGAKTALKVGNLQSHRCFSDVRDVVAAYRLIGEKGSSGCVYNVGSDRLCSIEVILETLIGYSDSEITVLQDETKLRFADSACYSCDNALLRHDTGWTERYRTEDTLLEVLNYFRAGRE